MYTYGAKVWALCLVQGPFYVALCRTLFVRFATFTSLQALSITPSDLLASLSDLLASPRWATGHYTNVVDYGSSAAQTLERKRQQLLDPAVGQVVSSTGGLKAAVRAHATTPLQRCECCES
jgi:hypothetical protein